MSASTTRTRVRAEERGAVVDRLGYTVCLDCWGDVLLSTVGAVWVSEHSLAGEPPECARCHRPIAECSPLRYEAIATVEHVQCKIF